jgi:hypothetical protein
MVANGRHRKTKIVQLEQEEGIIVGDANLKDYIIEYYKTTVWTSCIEFFLNGRDFEAWHTSSVRGGE